MKEKLRSNVPMQPNIPPMPSNTSNALEALDSANATQSNALDSISRQEVINAIEEIRRIAENELHYGKVLTTFNIVLNSLINIINLLQPAQPLNQDSIETQSSDLISRQAALGIAFKYCPDDDGTCSEAGTDLRDMIDELENLPPAQPEIIRCKDCKYYNSEEKECLDLLGHGRRWEEYDFCSYAERKQNDTERC